MNNTEFRSGAINASECLDEGWNLIKPNYGVFLGMATVFIILVFLINLIPVVGGILNVFLSGALLSGIYHALLNQLRGTNATFSMMFGTLDRIVPTSLVQLSQMLLWIILSVTTFILQNFTTEFDVPVYAPPEMSGYRAIFSVCSNRSCYLSDNNRHPVSAVFRHAFNRRPQSRFY